MKKTNANSHVRLQVKVLIGIVLLFVSVTAEETHRLRTVRAELDRLTTLHADAARRTADESRFQQLLQDQKQVLQSYETRLPYVDGYVWLSKFLRDTAPGLQLSVNPPDLMGQQVLSLNEYCTGTFRVRGTGGKEDLLHLLRQIEGDLAFARVQDVQFAFNDNSRTRVQFTFSVMLLMRLHEAPAADQGQVVASYEPAPTR